MAMEHVLFQDVFPIENDDFPASHVSVQEGIPFGYSFSVKILNIKN